MRGSSGVFACEGRLQIVSETLLKHLAPRLKDMSWSHAALLTYIVACCVYSTVSESSGYPDSRRAHFLLVTLVGSQPTDGGFGALDGAL